MTDNVISLVDVLAPPNSTQPTRVPPAHVMANGADPCAYPADFVEHLPDAGPRRPVLLTAADGALPYRALTERHLIPAFRQAGLVEIPAVVIPQERIQAEVATLSERFSSTEDTLERASICDTVTRSLNQNQDQVAERLTISRRSLRRYRSLRNLHPAALRLLVNGKLGLTRALACSDAPSSRRAELALTAAECALSRQQTRELVSRVRQCPDAEMLERCPQMVAPQPSADAVAEVETPEPASEDAATTSGSESGSESSSDGSGGSEEPHDTQDSALASGDVPVPVIPNVDVTRYTSQLGDDLKLRPGLCQFGRQHRPRPVDGGPDRKGAVDERRAGAAETSLPPCCRAASAGVPRSRCRRLRLD